MLFQNTPLFPIDMQHYACRFLMLARSREVLLNKRWESEELVHYWETARDAGIISGDLNMDGDYDDRGEDEILDDDRLFVLMGLPLHTVDVSSLGLPLIRDHNGILRVAPTKAPLDSSRYWVSECWGWKIYHFIQGDGTGLQKAIYDPIQGGSLTRKNGRIETLRVWEIN